MRIANTIRFGVELETTIPANDPTPIGGYHRGLPVEWLPAGWKVERDSSIVTVPGRKAAEFVSPVLSGAEGLASVETACEAIKARRGKVNSSCGVHVTVEFNGDARSLARLVNLVSNHEAALYAATGSRRREQGRWAKKVKHYGNGKNAKRYMDCDRYHLLNLTHIAAGRSRVEFRVFSGSLNPAKVAAWVQVCIGLVELACSQKRATSWDYKKKAGTVSCWDRPEAGDGEVEINRLFYRLGWTKGNYKGADRDRTWGLIEGAARGPKSVKKTLRGLARTYDQS